MGFPLINPAIQFVDDDGQPLVGAQLFSYVVSTSTKTTTWSNAELSAANTNPIILDAAGRCAIFLTDGVEYKFVLAPADDTDPPQNPIWTRDKVKSPQSLTAAAIGAALYPRTAAEIAAGVTPTSYEIISGDTGPGDIRRYGVTNSSSASLVAAAVQKALASHGYAFIPYGDTGLWNWNPVLFTGQYQQIVFARSVRASSVSAGDLIDFDGYAHCTVTGGKLLSATAARGIRVGNDAGNTRNAHWFKVIDVDLNGSSNGTDTGGTVAGFTTAAVQIATAFYGTVRGCDISKAARGVHGTNQCNGNFIVQNSIRDCHRGVHMDDATVNSDGCVIAENEIEGGATGNLYAIDIEGCSNMMVARNRLEYSTNGTAHIYVHEGDGVALRHSLHDNRCIGNIASLKIGDDSGANKVQVTDILGGYYSGSVTIGVDADYTSLDLSSNRAISSGATLPVNNSATSIISFLNDQSFTVGITGLTTTPTATWLYSIAKNIVCIDATQLNGTSNTTACTITGLPALIRPPSSQVVTVLVTDNGTTVVSRGVIDSSGVLTLSATADGGAFTNSGTKGILGCTITYSLR